VAISFPEAFYSLFPTIGIFFAAKQVYPGLKIDPSLAVGTMMMIAASIISLTAPGIEVAGNIQLSLISIHCWNLRSQDLQATFS